MENEEHMILMSETLHDSHVLSRLGFVPQQASSHWVSALQWPPLVALQQCAVPLGSTTESLRICYKIIQVLFLENWNPHAACADKNIQEP